MIMLLIKSIIATPNKQFDVAIISWNQHINSHYDYSFWLSAYATKASKFDLSTDGSGSVVTSVTRILSSTNVALASLLPSAFLLSVR